MRYLEIHFLDLSDHVREFCFFTFESDSQDFPVVFTLSLCQLLTEESYKTFNKFSLFWHLENRNNDGRPVWPERV